MGIWGLFFAWDVYDYTQSDFFKEGDIPLHLEPKKQSSYFDEIQPIFRDGYEYTFEPYHLYKAGGEIIGKSEPNDELTPIAPVDLSIGWGKMLEEEWREAVTYSNTGRILRILQPFPLEHREVAKYTLNNHLIASNEEIADMILETEIGDTVSVEGFLVDVHIFKNGQEVSFWETSTDPDDYGLVGGNACEIIYVTRYKKNGIVYE